MAYFKVHQKSSELNELRQNGCVRGENTGFKPLDEICSLKKGYPIFIAGAPHHGKTEVTIEMLLNTSVLHGWKHFVYLGENGEIEEVIAELCYKYIGKSFKSKSDYAMTESERIQAEMFIDEHFVFVDDNEDMSLTDFYDLATKAELQYKIKFDTTLFDPFNDAIDESLKMGGIHHWLNRELKLVRRISKKNNRIDILINHINGMPTAYDVETKKPYIRMALPTEWNGGTTWYRRGFLMILAYVPPPWLKDDDGVPYGENTTLLHIQKAKPKGVATYNKVARLTWDWKVNRYCWEEMGNKKFAFVTNKSSLPEPKMKPNTNFYEVEKEDIFGI